MKRVVNIIEAISHIASGHVTGWMILALMCLVMVEVTSRYVFNQPLAVADEIGGYMLVAITFIALAYTFKEKGHVRIEVVVDRLSPKVRNWLRLITLIMATALAPVLIMAAYDLVAYSHNHSLRAWTWLRTPLEWPQMALGIGAVLLLLQLIAELVKAIGDVRTPRGNV